VTRITTHVLDTAAGKPARGVPVALFRVDPGGAEQALGSTVTDSDGRVAGGEFVDVLGPCVCRLVFTTATAFFPEVTVTFTVEAGREHLHVPLLLSPYGYTTYRGS
jgi:5-hydroxyisourate hydrolase